MLPEASLGRLLASTRSLLHVESSPTLKNLVDSKELPDEKRDSEDNETRIFEYVLPSVVLIIILGVTLYVIYTRYSRYCLTRCRARPAKAREGPLGLQSPSLPVPMTQAQTDRRYRERTVQRDGRLVLYASTIANSEIRIESPQTSPIPVRLDRPSIADVGLAATCSHTNQPDSHAAELALEPPQVHDAAQFDEPIPGPNIPPTSIEAIANPHSVHQSSRRQRTQSVQLRNESGSPPHYTGAAGVNASWRFSQTGSTQTHSTEPLPEYATFPPSSSRASSVNRRMST